MINVTTFRIYCVKVSAIIQNEEAFHILDQIFFYIGYVNIFIFFFFALKLVKVLYNTCMT